MASNDRLYPKKHYASLVAVTVLFVGVIYWVTTINRQCLNEIERYQRLGDVAQTAVVDIARSANTLKELMAVRDPADTHSKLTLLSDFANVENEVSAKLAALNGGGVAALWYGETVTLAGVDPDLRPLIAESVKNWQVVDKSSSNLHVSAAGDVSANFSDAPELLDAKRTIDRYAEPTVENLKKAVVSLRARQKQAADKATLTMTSVVAIALAYFLLFFLYFIQRMMLTDNAAETSRREIEQIMDNISVGVFLLNKDFSISLRYSSEIETMLGTTRIGGRYFPELFRDMLKPDDLTLVNEYLTQLFMPGVSLQLIKDLNPLENAKVSIRDFTGNRLEKYLSFKFSRVYRGKKIQRVLVTVTDTTRQTLMDQRMRKEQRKTEGQTEVMIGILNNDAQLVRSFVHSSTRALGRVRDELDRARDRQSKSPDEHRRIAGMAQSEVHGVKGEASALKFRSIYDRAVEFEDVAKEVRDGPQSKPSDLQKLYEPLDELASLIAMVKDLIEKIAEIGNRRQAPDGRGSAQGVYARYFSNFANDIAKRRGKKVAFASAGLEMLSASTAATDGVKEIAIQLLRNAITHGVEDPPRRAALGKTPHGNVRVTLEPLSGCTRLTVEDDGGGIDFEKLKRKALNMGAYNPAQIAAMGTDLSALLFVNGLSAADSADEDAGRGVGMDAVRARTVELRGQFHYATIPGRMTRFVIDFPFSLK